MVEERGKAWLEAAADDGGGVGQAFCEDWGCGELVLRLVRVVEDYDLRLGWDGLGRERTAEADWAGPAALAADRPRPPRRR